MGFDFLQVSDPGGAPLAAVLRTQGQAGPVQPKPRACGAARAADARRPGLSDRFRTHHQAEENIAILLVGERFDFSEFSTPAVLLRDGRILKSSLPGISVPEAEAALRDCRGQTECDVRLGGAVYISLPLQGVFFGDACVLRSLQNLDAATGPLLSILNYVFLLASFGVVLAALLFSFVSSQSLVKPIAARRHLQLAYVEFVGSLASALDARDRYTSGHSGRVSEHSCATALAMGIQGEQLDEIRIGALLHDIGKIGVSDTVLQKPGRLTAEEFALVRQHPSIGRRILEVVQGFAPYLAAVELHHENWDGSGYPHGHVAEQTPLAARIIHVSDAYDAMTTDRPYRRGMSPGKW